MPADSSHNPQVRRSSRKHASEDDVDLRRARGEISCAECRRLKLKCDKKLPCSSCVRRGCPSICPLNSLSTGQGTRFVLADTSQLHTKITEMGQRIRQLEDALAISQSGVSNEPHPLLRDELLTLKFGPENSSTVAAPPRSRDPSLDSIDAFGTLTIFDRDQSKYFGRSAGSEANVATCTVSPSQEDIVSSQRAQAGAEMEPSWLAEDEQASPLTPDVLRLSDLFPLCAEGDVEKAMVTLFAHLPERPRAWALCETYLEQAAWYFQPLRREELIDEILTPVYRSLKERASAPCDAKQPHSVSPHRLAALYIIFALGALVDLTLEPFNSEAESFYLLCRAALSLKSVFDSPEICTVQTVVLISAYQTLAGKRYTLDSAWSVMSLGAKLAQSIGLHRDGSRWNFDPQTVNRRRALFYEIYSSEQFHSLAIGRPPAIRMSYVDCEFPTEDEPMVDDEGKPLIGYFQWKYEFARDILAQVLECTLTAQSPNYQTILDLDRKVREKTLPPHLNVFMSADDEHCTPRSYMQRCTLGQYRSVILLFIHRSFFAQAMLDHPLNPLRSPFAPSFLAAYRCASGVIKATLNHYDRFPDLVCRWWGVWSHLFSAAIIVGSIVTRSPSSTMAPNAFIELGLACDLFEKCAKASRRARSALAILTKLRDKAFQVYSQHRSGNTPIPSVLSVGGDYGDDELALFGGQTRVMFSKLLQLMKARKTHSELSSTTHSPASESSSPSETSESHSDSLPDVHPSLVEYISLLPPSQHPRSSPAGLASNQSYPDPLALSNYYNPSDAELRNPYFTPSMMSTQDPNGTAFSPYLSNMGSSQSGAFTTEPTDINDSPAHNSGDLMDLDLMISGVDSGIDEQWRSFMRDSGLLDHRLGQ